MHFLKTVTLRTLKMHELLQGDVGGDVGGDVAFDIFPRKRDCSGCSLIPCSSDEFWLT